MFGRFYFFFFKQKTAYEMRISDWSSDVCSSDLIPSTSIEQSLDMQRKVERVISSFPQVQYVFSKTGTAEVASDPMPPNQSDGFVILKPQEEWPDPDLPKEVLIEQMSAKLETLVGNSYEFTQPIEMRFNELISGVRGDVAIKLYGDDLDQMTSTATEIGNVLRSIDGSADVRVEQTGGFPTLDFQFDRTAIAGLGLSVEERSEEHTSELQSLMRISYAVFLLKKNNENTHSTHIIQ